MRTSLNNLLDVVYLLFLEMLIFFRFFQENFVISSWGVSA